MPGNTGENHGIIGLNKCEMNKVNSMIWTYKEHKLEKEKIKRGRYSYKNWKHINLGNSFNSESVTFYAL
jgi:hypothetical protein